MAPAALSGSPAARPVRGALGEALAVVLVAVALTAPWVRQGIDFTDDGGHLVDQRLLLEHGWTPTETFGALFWLSDVAGAGWLWLTDALGLLGARLGWVAIMAATALVTWALLRRRVPGTAAVAATGLACAVTLAHGTRMLIDYNKVPYLFIIAGLACLPEPEDTATRRGTLRSLAAGAAFALAGLARTPSALAVLLPLLPPLQQRLIDGAWDPRRLRRAVPSLAGSLAVFALAALALALRGDLRAVATLLASALAEPVHRPTVLLGRYGQDLLLVGASALLWCALAALLARVCTRGHCPGALACTALAAGVGGVALLAVRTFGAPAVSRGFVVVVAGGCLALLLLSGASLARSARDEPGPRRGELGALADLLLLGLAGALAACAGTGDGAAKLAHGFWIPVPAALLAGMLLLRGRKARGGGLLVCALGAALALGALAIRWQYPFRDHPDRRALTAGIAHPRLRGILTTPARARSVTALLRELGARVAPGETLFAAGGIPLVHYLTGTVPVPGTTWQQGVPAAALVRGLDGRRQDGKTLPPVVRARVDFEAASWAHAPTGPPRGRAVGPALDRWLERNGYAVAWANAEFEILLPGAAPRRVPAPRDPGGRPEG